MKSVTLKVNRIKNTITHLATCLLQSLFKVRNVPSMLFTHKGIQLQGRIENGL